MKNKSTKTRIICLIVFTLFLLNSISCGRKPDVSQFIDKASYDEAYNKCGISANAECIYNAFEPKVKNYCLDNKLSDSECQQIKLEVIRQMGKFAGEDTKKLKEIMDEMKRGRR